MRGEAAEADCLSGVGGLTPSPLLRTSSMITDRMYTTWTRGDQEEFVSQRGFFDRRARGGRREETAGLAADWRG